MPETDVPETVPVPADDATPEPAESPAVDSLIEDVSIDGMCGVY